MQINKPETGSTDTLSMTIRIDSLRAGLLYGTACGASGNWDDRFEVAGGSRLHEHTDGWSEGRFMWCDSALSAFVLADYEVACGFRSEILWDLYADEMGEQGHVVLSSRPLD